MPAEPFEITSDPGKQALTAAGGICAGSAAEFSRDFVRAAAGLGESTAEIRVELDDLDLLDGTAVAEALNAVRRILETGRRLRIHRAPQMLAHSLYKAGLLMDGRIRLIEPVEEESTAN